MYIVYKSFDFARRSYAFGGFHDINVDVGEAEGLRKRFVGFVDNFVVRFIFNTSVDLSTRVWKMQNGHKILRLTGD